MHNEFLPWNMTSPAEVTLRPCEAAFRQCITDQRGHHLGEGPFNASLVQWQHIRCPQTQQINSSWVPKSWCLGLCVLSECLVFPDGAEPRDVKGSLQLTSQRCTAKISVKTMPGEAEVDLKPVNQLRMQVQPTTRNCNISA
eukprot:s75_g10.t1